MLLVRTLWFLVVSSWFTSAVAAETAPCDNFYRYSCGEYIKSRRAEKPDAILISKAGELNEKLHNMETEIIEQPMDLRLKQFRRICLLDSERLVNRSRIENILKNRISKSVSDLHKDGIDVFVKVQPHKNSKVNRDIVSLTTPKDFPVDLHVLLDPISHAAKYAEYEQLLRNMSEFLSPTWSLNNRQLVQLLRFQQRLARFMLHRTNANYNKVRLAGLARAFPVVKFSLYRDVISPEYLRSRSIVHIHNPTYLDWVGKLIRRTRRETVRNHMVVMYVEGFYRHLFEPQTKRASVCTEHARSLFADVISDEFVVRHLSNDTVQELYGLCKHLRNVMTRMINKTGWLLASGKEMVTKKAKNMKLNVGTDKYPENKGDYVPVLNKSTSLPDTLLLIRSLKKRVHLARIGKESKLVFNAIEANAHYTSLYNTIGIPAGFLQEPIYRNNLSLAEFYGSLGSILLHEMFHSLDKDGQKFDETGSVNRWMKPEEKKLFANHSRCLLEELDRLGIQLFGAKLNSEQFLTENLADNAGLHMALMSFLDQYANTTGGELPSRLEMQKFFESFALFHCGYASPQIERSIYLFHTHGPPELRVNAAVHNMPMFHQTYNCSEPEQPLCLIMD